jgi:hypothetical protein
VTLHARTEEAPAPALQSKQASQSVQWQLARRSIDGAHADAAIVFVFPVPVPVHGHGPVFLHTRSYASRAANKQVHPHAGGRRGGTKVARAAFLDVLPAGSTSIPARLITLLRCRPTRETFRCVQQQHHPPTPITDVGVWISSGCRRRVRHACRRRPGRNTVATRYFARRARMQDSLFISRWACWIS